MGWLRVSECSQCGECCRWLAIGTVKELRKVAKEFLLVRGAVFKDGLILIPFVCPHLREPHWVSGMNEPNIDDRDFCHMSKHVCDIHDHKPAICKEFHGNKTVRGFPSYVPPGCTMKKV
jgi:hypothetical protein